MDSETSRSDSTTSTLVETQVDDIPPYHKLFRTTLAPLSMTEEDKTSDNETYYSSHSHPSSRSTSTFHSSHSRSPNLRRDTKGANDIHSDLDDSSDCSTEVDVAALDIADIRAQVAYSGSLLPSNSGNRHASHIPSKTDPQLPWVYLIDLVQEYDDPSLKRFQSFGRVISGDEFIKSKSNTQLLHNQAKGMNCQEILAQQMGLGYDVVKILKCGNGDGGTWSVYEGLRIDLDEGVPCIPLSNTSPNRFERDEDQRDGDGDDDEVPTSEGIKRDGAPQNQKTKTKHDKKPMNRNGSGMQEEMMSPLE